MNVIVNDDELRLLRFFRCLSHEKQSDILRDVGSQALIECIPDKSIYDLMPDAAGVEPEGTEYLHNEYSVCHIIYCGIQETGEPKETLLGSSYWDEEEAIPRFTSGAKNMAIEQGSFFNYDKDFAREYIKAWRNEIVFACLRAKEEDE